MNIYYADQDWLILKEPLSARSVRGLWHLGVAGSILGGCLNALFSWVASDRAGVPVWISWIGALWALWAAASEILIPRTILVNRPAREITIKNDMPFQSLPRTITIRLSDIRSIDFNSYQVSTGTPSSDSGDHNSLAPNRISGKRVFIFDYKGNSDDADKVGRALKDFIGIPVVERSERE